MSTISCLNIISELNRATEKINYQLCDNMTDHSMEYMWACIKPNLSYDYYYKALKKEWEKIINEFINQPNPCNDILSNFIELRYASPEKLNQFQKILDVIKSSSDESEFKKRIMTDIDIDDIVLDVLATSIMKSDKLSFELTPDLMSNMVSLAETMVKHCQCQIVDIYKMVIKYYKKKYFKKFQGKNKNEIIELLRKDYYNFKEIIKNLDMDQADLERGNFLDRLAGQFTGIYGFSIGSELERLIPNELGSLKDFFIKVISRYYENLHPIIWAQIFKSFSENIFIDLPFTPDEFFSFGSKQLLLNSGPFILKILQMIRPVLSPELAEKYNLTKLTYPELSLEETDLILGKSVHDWDMHRIIRPFSASVGHVVKVLRVDDPANVFMIKIIKPLAVAQSCWEYRALENVYSPASCEQAFIRNILESNGRELNVQNEINNIIKGHEVYTATYQEIFGEDLDVTLTTIQNRPGIIFKNCWYALTMTLAPGFPLSKLIENDELKHDTLYRAKLHRCFDILIFKFFQNIIKNGYYHGDLHSGNIFYSYEQNQMTLIDFGAVGEINIYQDNPDIRTLLDIVVMSIFYNYDEMLDVMTELLNNRCTETQIDWKSPEYLELGNDLFNHKIKNMRNQETEKRKSKIYIEDTFSVERIQQEKAGYTQYTVNIFDPKNVQSIYSYLEYAPRAEEAVVENRDVLPEFTEILGESQSITFSGVLEKIIKFYALSGVNVAIKFSEFYDFQKAYALLLGVLAKVGYSSYRSSMAIKKAILNISNVPELLHVGTATHVFNKYRKESEKYNNLNNELEAYLY